jgi:hypothetical protein
MKIVFSDLIWSYAFPLLHNCNYINLQIQPWNIKYGSECYNAILGAKTA